MNKTIIAALITISTFLPLNSFAQTELDYDQGIVEVQNLIKKSSFKEAQTLIEALLEKYPDNVEFKTILARLYKWQNKYDQSLTLYKELAAANPDNIEIQSEYQKLSASQEIENLKNLEAQIGPYQYEEKLREFYNSGKDIYTSGFMLGSYYIKNRDFKKASVIFGNLRKTYTNDKDLNIMYIESLLDSKEYSQAAKVFSELLEVDRNEIKKSREDLIYRLEKNYVSLLYGQYVYGRDIPNEHDVIVEASQQIGNFTLVPRISNITRFNLNDTQASFDLYSPLGDKRWGYISASVTPDAEFLPVWTAGAEFYQGIGNSEFSIGYSRLNFKDLGVNIVKPGVRVYLPNNFAIDEKLTIVPEQLAFLLTSTLNYEPNHKFRAYYSLGVGQISERITASQDLSKLTTYIHTLGIQYRPISKISINTELLYNYREGLYDIKGASIFTRYWW